MSQTNYKNLISIIEQFNNGKKKEALINLDQILKLDNQNKDLLLVKVKFLLNMERATEAINELLKILSISPKNIEVLDLLYSNLIKIKNYDQAEIYLDRFLNTKNLDYKSLRDKAYLLYLKKNIINSEKYIKNALKINNKDVFGLNIFGLIKLQQNRSKEAIKIFKEAISIDADYIDSYNNIGKCYINLENLTKAYSYFKKAYKKNLRSSLAIINIANVLSLKGKYKTAIKLLNKAKEINPNNPIIDENISINKCRSKDLEWVEKYYNKIKTSDNINYDFVLGFSYLLLCNYEFDRGFDLFDSRLKSQNFHLKNIHHKNIVSKISLDDTLDKDDKILVVKEQGVGDEILFSSLYKDLINFYPNTKIECDSRLINIFKRSFNKDIFYEFGFFTSSTEKLKYFDKVLYAGSLTKYFRRDIKQFIQGPYIKSDKSKDADIAAQISKFNKTKKIGISWKSVFNIYGGLKSLNLEDFHKIFNNKRTIFNIQYGDVDDDLKKLNNEGYFIYNFQNYDLFNNFEALISILKNIDVFVTVSNSTAHFSAALGVPTILICPKKTSTYYYWNYEDGKTPWYSSVKIITFQDSINKTIDIVNDFIDSTP